MKASLQRLLLALLTGVIFVYYSELVFWARPFEGSLPPDIVPTTLLYGFAAYVFLTVVTGFKIRRLEALLLAGAVFGWLIEGVIAQTMYEDFPFNLSFTGLAWHALITVMVGWYLVQRLLREGNLLRLACLGAFIGLVYGLWATWWWTEIPPPTPFPAFTGYAFGSTLVLIGAYWASGRIRLPGFRPHRVEIQVLVGIVAAYFIFIAVPAQPLALVILPPLAAVVFLTLHRNARLEPGDDWVSVQQQYAGVSMGNAMCLLLIPLIASVVYGVALRAEWRPATGIVLYLVTMPLGFALLVLSIVRLWRRADTRATPAG